MKHALNLNIVSVSGKKMNKRIKELMEEVGAVRNVLAMGRHDGVLFTESELEKFAELIVQETVLEVWIQLFNHGIDLSENTLFLEAMKKTKEKFGVE